MFNDDNDGLGNDGSDGGSGESLSDSFDCVVVLSDGNSDFIVSDGFVFKGLSDSFNFIVFLCDGDGDFLGDFSRKFGFSFSWWGFEGSFSRRRRDDFRSFDRGFSWGFNN